ncbi:hypothetical protein ZWY2020_029945 [Hordeum vulgare]|nr:hypothetical protein ZWY2020_029945 [Hordeum vulgare]
MNGRLVHLVARAATIGGRQAYTLHPIDPSTFFFHSTKQSGADDGMTTMEEFQPPPPAMTFHGPDTEAHDMDFMPVGDKGLLAVDCEGSAVLYSAATQTLTTIPTLRAPKVDPIFFPVGDTHLYVMDRKPRRDPRRCFAALIRGRGSGPCCRMAWHWRSLPPPPYLPPYRWDDDDNYSDDDGQPMVDDGSKSKSSSMVVECELGDVAGHAVVGDSKIWISTAGAGTYTFDTGSGAWAPRPLYWPLPFRGRAEYVPEHGLWFGFSSQTNLLCASDLAAASATRPPVVSGEWEDVMQAEGWIPVASYLVPLGSCRFLVAKFFETREWQQLKNGGGDYGKCDNFGVLAGVELLPKAGGGLSMMKHRSKRYSHICAAPDWVI